MPEAPRLIQSENTFLVGYVIFDKKQGKAAKKLAREIKTKKHRFSRITRYQRIKSVKMKKIIFLRPFHKICGETWSYVRIFMYLWSRIPIKNRYIRAVYKYMHVKETS